HFAANFVAHAIMPGVEPTLASAKQGYPMTMVAFPDRNVEIVDLFGEGDRVFVRTRVTGTNKGPAIWFNVMTPTGKAIDFESWAVYRFENGKVVESWGVNDGMMAMFQLGTFKM